jgi:hypothetical protein
VGTTAGVHGNKKADVGAEEEAMKNEDCPKCGASYPDVYSCSWGGGNKIVVTSRHCKKCGTRFKVIHNCASHLTTVEVNK